jgi:hypothetical protein
LVTYHPGCSFCTLSNKAALDSGSTYGSPHPPTQKQQTKNGANGQWSATKVRECKCAISRINRRC